MLVTEKLNVLILCTGNSARSIITEGLLNHLGGDRVTAYSAGSQPTGKPNPFALQALRNNGIDPSFARSKSWDEFAVVTAPEMDIIITVCANAAGETCPVWPGHPASAHWGVDDPAAISGSDEEISAGFARCFDQMKERVTSFLEGLGNGEDLHRRAKTIEAHYPDMNKTHP